jgi:hypothetical protein
MLVEGDDEHAGFPVQRIPNRLVHGLDQLLPASHIVQGATDTFLKVGGQWKLAATHSSAVAYP